MKLVDGKIEGETDSAAPGERRIAGEIKNFKLEGDWVTFEATYLDRAKTTNGRAEFNKSLRLQAQ